MRVFVIPSWYPTQTRPYWCNWVLPHISVLEKSNIEAYVLQVDIDSTDCGGFQPDKSHLVSSDHYYLSAPYVIKKHSRTRFFYSKILNFYTEKLRSLYVLAEAKWGRPDILHAHVSLPGGYGAMCLGREMGIPVIVTEHYSGFDSDARFWWRVGCYYRQVSEGVAGFYAVSPGFKKRLEAAGVKTTGVLPNPIDTEVFKPRVDRSASPPLRIVSTGTLSTIKGTDILLAALKILQQKLDWRLTLYGSNDNQKYFAKFFKDASFLNRITIAGRVSQDELAKAYSDSHLYVVSSRIETANVSMLQAIACGIPVVTTICGAPETLIDNSVGIAVSVNSPHALARGILSVSERLKDHNYDSLELRKYVTDRYSISAVQALVKSAYSKALDGKIVC